MEVERRAVMCWGRVFVRVREGERVSYVRARGWMAQNAKRTELEREERALGCC